MTTCENRNERAFNNAFLPEDNGADILLDACDVSEGAFGFGNNFIVSCRGISGFGRNNNAHRDLAIFPHMIGRRTGLKATASET
ncbi:hypothetical protein D3C79_966670 [compost metagenome]